MRTRFLWQLTLLFVLTLSIQRVGAQANATLKGDVIQLYDRGEADKAISILKNLSSDSETAFVSWLNIALIEYERNNSKASNEAIVKASRYIKSPYQFYYSSCKSILKNENRIPDHPSFQNMENIADPLEKFLVWQILYYYLGESSNDTEELYRDLKILKKNVPERTLRYAKVLSEESYYFIWKNEKKLMLEYLIKSNSILEYLKYRNSRVYFRNIKSLINYSEDNNFFEQCEKDTLITQNTNLYSFLNYHKGRYFTLKDQKEKAVQFLEKAYQLDNSNSMVLLYLAFVCKELKDYNSAFFYYNKLLNSDNAKTEAYLGAAECSYHLGNKGLCKFYTQLLIQYVNTENTRLNCLNRTFKFLYESNQPEYIPKLYKLLIEYSAKYPKEKLLASIYNDIGNYEWHQKNYEAALENFQLALLGILPKENTKDVYASLNFNGCLSIESLALYLNNKAETFYQLSKTRKNKNEEIRDLQESLKNLDLSIGQIYQHKMQLSTEEQQYVYSQLRSKRYPNIIKVCLELYNLTHDKKYYQQAFRYAEQGRATIMLSMLRSDKGKKIGLIPEKYKWQEDSINLEISKIHQKLSSLEEESPAVYTLNTQVDKLAAKRKELEQMYKKQYPDYYRLKYSSEVISAAEFQKTLADNECVVEFLLDRNFLISYYIDKTNLQIVTDTLRKVKLAAVAERFFQNTSHFSASHYSPDSIRQFTEDAHLLYTILLKPFEKKFKGKKLIIIADNSLRKIPFEVLLTQKVTDYSGYRNLPYLIKQNAVYYAPSVTFLNELRQRPVVKSRPRLLAVAPVYPSLKLNDTISRMLLAVRADTSIFSSLPNARKEVDFAHSIAGGRYLSEGQATETRFKKITHNYDIIHLATHGLLNSEASLQSRLLFADSQPDDDGFLHNYEIYNLNQSSQLVILSACNTGAGKNYGGEDVISTGRGFLSSGSRSVIMTLWSVNDQSSFELIKGFYEGLKDRKSICDALRNSKLNYLNKADNMHAHPFFWTGYVIYGDASIELPVNNYRVYYWLGALVLLVGFMVWRYYRKPGH